MGQEQETPFWELVDKVAKSKVCTGYQHGNLLSPSGPQFPNNSAHSVMCCAGYIRTDV